MRSNASLPVDGPHFRLSIHGAAEQELTSVIPVNRCDPCRVSCQVSNMLAVLHVVESDNGCVTGGSEPGGAGGKGYRADGLRQAWDAVRWWHRGHRTVPVHTC